MEMLKIKNSVSQNRELTWLTLEWTQENSGAPPPPKISSATADQNSINQLDLINIIELTLFFKSTQNIDQDRSYARP